MFNMTRTTEIILEKVQSNSNSFKKIFSTLEKKMAGLAHKIQFMTVGAETLFERIHTVKCINRALSKGYYRLTDRMSLQEGNIHAMRIMSKDEILYLMGRLHSL